MSKFWIISTQSSLDKARENVDGTPHHPNVLGGRFDCLQLHDVRLSFNSLSDRSHSDYARAREAARRAASGIHNRRMFISKEDAIAAGGRWMETQGVTDVVVIECDVIGSLKLREAPVVFVPAKKQRKKRKQK